MFFFEIPEIQYHCSNVLFVLQRYKNIPEIAQDSDFILIFATAQRDIVAFNGDSSPTAVSCAFKTAYGLNRWAQVLRHVCVGLRKVFR